MTNGGPTIERTATERAASLQPEGITASGLGLRYGDRPVIEDVDLSLLPGTVTAVVGANGSGKSTLLKGLARLLVPARGAVYLDGKAIDRQPTREVARRLAFLPQRADAPEGLTVRELVALGRFPHRGWTERLGAGDRDVVEQALRTVSVAHLGDAPVEQLSGGERQRAWIAMALAQETRYLLLDEPTTFLDLRHQIEILDVVERLHRDEGKTVVMVLHDLNLAARYAGRIIALREGRIVASGTPDEVITPARLREVFRIAARVLRDPKRGTPLCVVVGTAD